MLKCSYIILVHNHQTTLPKVIDSLHKIKGNFLREFIFIDDGSADNSVSVIKSCVSSLPKTTIITHSNIGPALSLNQAINLINGTYVHFVNGEEMVTPNSTSKLMGICEKMGSEVAFGISGTKEDKLASDANEIVLLDSPITAILKDKLRGIRDIGLPGSLVSSSLLEKIKGADSNIYSHNMSLSLKCAKYSKFVFVKEVMSLKVAVTVPVIERKFQVYNNLLAIHNFIKDNPVIAENYKNELISALHKELNKIPSSPFSLFANYMLMLLRPLKPSNLTQILKFYQQELSKLF